MKIKAIIATAAAVLAAVAHTAATAQANWPTKPVRMIVAAAPGGSTDIFGRLLSIRLGERLGQPFVVENRSGGGGSVGALFVAKSAPDGYTLLMTTDQLVAQAALIVSGGSSKLPYDPMKDFAPVGLVARGPFVLGVSNSFPAGSVAELVALVKSQPGKHAFSSCGHGTVIHLTGELFNLAAGIDMAHAAYRGCAPAILDAVSGQVPIFVTGLPNAVPFEKSGKVRLLGVTSLQRLAGFPNLPTIAESGFPGLNVFSWFGLLAPGATAKDIVTRLSAEVAVAVASPEFSERIRSMYMEPMANTPEFFADVMRADYSRWSKVVRDAKIKAD